MLFGIQTEEDGGARSTHRDDEKYGQNVAEKLEGEEITW
jgi:hypothetical protein